MNKILILALGLAVVSGTGILAHNVFSIDVQPFKSFNTFPDFDQPACECEGSDGAFSMTNCNAFDGNPYSDPNMLCQWEVGLEPYGEPSSKNNSCESNFWMNTAAGSGNLVAIPSIDTEIWPPGYQPHYYYEDMFHVTLPNIPENLPEDKNSKKDNINTNDDFVTDDLEEENNDDKENKSKDDDKENKSKDDDINYNENVLTKLQVDEPLEIADITSKQKDSDEDNSGEGSDGKDKTEKENSGNNEDKIVICHIPPGNPDKPKTISISPDAQETHLEHGDYLGECIVPDTRLTLLEALNLEGDGMNKLIRESVTAMLNAAHSEVNYPYTVVEVITMTQISLANSDYDETGNVLEELNTDLPKPLLCSG